MLGNTNFGFSGGGSSTPPPSTTSWMLNGNAVTSEKYFGTNDNFSIPLYTNGLARGIFLNTGDFGFGTVSPTSRVHIQGVDSTSSNYALKVDNSASSPLLYVRNDGNVYSHGVGSVPTNTSFGLNNLLSNTIGADNTVYGVNAMIANTTGSNNTVFGKDALYNNNTGSFNSAFGYISLESNKSERNTALGYGSLSINTTGFRNTSVGMFSGNVNQSGDNNIFIGYNANPSVGNLSNAIAIGSGAVVSQSNTMALGDNVNVTIGSTSASARLYVKGVDSTLSNYAIKIDNSASSSLFYVRNDGYATIMNAIFGRGGGLISSNTAFGVGVLMSNTTGFQNTGFGNGVFNSNTTGRDNSGFGNGALVSNNGNFNSSFGSGSLGSLTSGGQNSAFGYSSGYNNNGSNGVFLGYQAGYWETASNKLFIDNDARLNEADGRIKSLIYGVFSSALSSQSLTVNAGLFRINTGTASENTIGETVNTTDATANVTAQTIAVATNTVISIESTIVYRKTGGAGVGTTGDGTTIKLNSSVKNVGGTLTLDTVQNTYTGTTNAIVGVSATYTISGTNVLVSVTGVLNDNITWNVITKVNTVA